MPQFCVVIPTKNRCQYLRHALRSILRQTYRDLTVVVSDNNSSDDTRDFVCSISDSRLRYVNPGQSLSIVDNWNFALSHAMGEFVLLLSDDDYLLPGMLQDARSIISQDPTVDIVGFARNCGYTYPMPSGTGNACTWVSPAYYSARYVDPQDYTRRFFQLSNPAHMSSFIFRRALAEQAKYNGAVFHIPCPDIYAFPILSSFARKIYYFHKNGVIIGTTPVSSTVLHVANDTRPRHPDHANSPLGDPVPGEFPGYSMMNTALRSLVKAKQHFPEQTADFEINMEGYFRTASRQYASHWINGIVPRRTLIGVLQALSVQRRGELFLDLGLAVLNTALVRSHLRPQIGRLRRAVLTRLGRWDPAVQFHRFGSEVQDIEGCWQFLKDKV